MLPLKQIIVKTLRVGRNCLLIVLVYFYANRFKLAELL